MDMTEFIPYVFHIFAQLFEYYTGLGSIHTLLFPSLIKPSLCECKGNITELARLIQFYINNCGNGIVSGVNIGGVLGLFQNILTSRSRESNVFDMLSTIVLYFPSEYLQPFLKTMIQILPT